MDIVWQLFCSIWKAITYAQIFKDVLGMAEGENWTKGLVNAKQMC